MGIKKWKSSCQNLDNTIESLMRKYRLPHPVALYFAARGIKEEMVPGFLNPKLAGFSDPYRFPGIQNAALPVQAVLVELRRSEGDFSGIAVKPFRDVRTRRRADSFDLDGSEGNSSPQRRTVPLEAVDGSALFVVEVRHNKGVVVLHPDARIADFQQCELHRRDAAAFRGTPFDKQHSLVMAVDQNFRRLRICEPEIAVGAEYIPNPIGRNYLQRICYRVGVNYTTPYLNLPQYEGPSEYSINAGFGFPLYLFQRRTILNLTGQYVRVRPSVTNMLSENRFVIKLGLTFNEHWFMKWKVN